MHANIVLTLTGRDRVGIVEEVTQLLLDLGGNVETSRMARLGGEFAVLMLASLPSDQLARLENKIQLLTAQGYKVTTSQTELTYAEKYLDWLPYQIEVRGADHKGIIHEIAHLLSQGGINIESMETGTRPAPLSGSPLFTMTALVLVPPHLARQGWEAGLEDVGQRLNVETVRATRSPIAPAQPQ
jgi:glycine cleavage system transcriptional repressor